MARYRSGCRRRRLPPLWLPCPCLMRPSALAFAIVLFGLPPATSQATDERGFLVTSTSSGSVNDCSLRVRSNEATTVDAGAFRARPRSQALTVWVDPGFIIPATFIDCQGNTVAVPGGTTVTQYVDLLLDVASCRLQADQGLAGDVNCCVEIRRSGALVATASPLATPGTINSGAECAAVHGINADLKFVNAIPAGSCASNSLCGQNTGGSLIVVGSGNCASATTAHELGHMQGNGHTCSSGATCSDGTACPCTSTFGGGGSGTGSCASAGCPAAGTCTNEIMWWTACTGVNQVVINSTECNNYQSGAQQ